MKKFFCKMKNRIKSHSGMSLSETLVAVLILSLASMILVTTISLAAGQFADSMRNSEARSLYSSLMTIISNDLAYTDPDKVVTDSSNNVTKYTSTDYGVTGIFETDIDGHLTLTGSGDGSSIVELLGSGSYPKGLTAEVASITYQSSSGVFTVGLNIGYKGSSIYSGTFDVLCVNE